MLHESMLTTLMFSCLISHSQHLKLNTLQLKEKIQHF